MKKIKVSSELTSSLSSKAAKKEVEFKFREIMAYLKNTPFETIALNNDIKPSLYFIHVPNIYMTTNLIANRSTICFNLDYGKPALLTETLYGTTEEINIKLQFYKIWLEKEEELINLAKNVHNGVNLKNE